jgi:hypothetical protein
MAALSVSRALFAQLFKLTAHLMDHLRQFVQALLQMGLVAFRPTLRPSIIVKASVVHRFSTMAQVVCLVVQPRRI